MVFFEITDAVSCISQFLPTAAGRNGNFEKNTIQYSLSISYGKILALLDPQALMNAWACACDTNGDFAISFEESQSTECAKLQAMLLGQNMDQATFEKYDLDNNNILDINDVLNWGNLMSGGAAGFDRSKFDILPFFKKMNSTLVINLAFQIV